MLKKQAKVNITYLGDVTYSWGLSLKMQLRCDEALEKYEEAYQLFASISEGCGMALTTNSMGIVLNNERNAGEGNGKAPDGL